MVIHVLKDLNNIIKGYSSTDMQNTIEIDIDLDLNTIELVNNYKLVDGKLIELTAEEKVDLETLKQDKINKLSNACNNAIVNGFYSDADGTKKLYDFELENQVNMATKAYQIQLAQLAGQTPSNISYYAKGGECHEYTPAQFLQLAQDGETWKTGCITKYKDVLKPKVMACTTKEEIEAIIWESDASATQTTV